MTHLAKTHQLVLVQRVERRILLIRGEKVMLDSDLAALYGVSTGALNQAVRRNPERFPSDFMFQLTGQELGSWRSRPATSRLISQSVMSKRRRGGRRHLPFAFTEQGVAMLSSVLKSRRAVQVNIAIMRAFVRLRKMIAAHEELADKIKELEEKFQQHDQHFDSVFQALRALLDPKQVPLSRKR